MFISPAYAQAAGGGGGDLFGFLIPLIAMVGIFYFLVMRPQQKRLKDHAAMVANIRRGDTIVTNGGIVGKVAKVTEDPEILVELAEGVKVKVVRDMISQVRVKGEPADEGGKK
ncbi:MAG: preprotein translocase subunit YajC [Hyphomicrobiales bacterium]